MHRALALPFSAVLMLALATPADAQRHRVVTGSHHGTKYSLEVFGGGVDFGAFLEEEVAPAVAGVTPAQERELVADRTWVVGGALSVQPWQKAAIRAGVAWAPSQFQYRDDSGTGADALDTDDLGDVDLLLLDLSVLYNVLDPGGTFVPYAIAGVSMGRWNAGTEAGSGGSGLLLGDGDASHWRLGGVGGAGLDIAATDRVGLRLEFATFAVGNPFDGDDAFVVGGDARKVDEPSITRVSRLTAGVLVDFAGTGSKHRPRRGR